MYIYIYISIEYTFAGHTYCVETVAMGHRGTSAFTPMVLHVHGETAYSCHLLNIQLGRVLIIMITHPLFVDGTHEFCEQKL